MMEALLNGVRGIVNAGTWLYQTVADIVSPDHRPDTGLVGVVQFPRSRQRNGYTCGPRSLLAVATHFRRDVEHDRIMEAVGTTQDGTSATPMIAYLRTLGLRAARHNRMRLAELERALDAGKVAIVDLDGSHWSVVHAMTREHVWLADPSSFSMPRARTSRARFRRRWTGLCILVSEAPPRRINRAAGNSNRNRRHASSSGIRGVP